MSEEKENRSVFDKLNAKDVNSYIEKKKSGGKELSYLSWASAWAEVKKIYPNASYEIKRFGDSKLPYVFDANTGYMVFTEVTIEGLTHEMWLPVMDYNNQAMKAEPYTYQVIKWTNGRRDGYIDKTVEAATMFDVNKTIMRCLTKNLAMFGLGLYIYAGEDLPEEATGTVERTKTHYSTPALDLAVSGHARGHNVEPGQLTPHDVEWNVQKRVMELWGKEKGLQIYKALLARYQIKGAEDFDQEKIREYMEFIENVSPEELSQEEEFEL